MASWIACDRWNTSGDGSKAVVVCGHTPNTRSAVISPFIPMVSLQPLSAAYGPFSPVASIVSSFTMLNALLNCWCALSTFPMLWCGSTGTSFNWMPWAVALPLNCVDMKLVSATFLMPSSGP